MNKLIKSTKNFIANEEGATTVEYIFLIALIILAVYGVVRALASAMKGKFTNTTTDLKKADK